MAAPNPPFSHADTATALMWNKVLYDNPCETWPEEAKNLYRLQIRRSPKPSVRPG